MGYDLSKHIDPTAVLPIRKIHLFNEQGQELSYHGYKPIFVMFHKVERIGRWWHANYETFYLPQIPPCTPDFTIMYMKVEGLHPYLTSINPFKMMYSPVGMTLGFPRNDILIPCEGEEIPK